MNKMKNILVTNSSDDGTTNCLIDDLDKLDLSIPEEKNIFDIIMYDIAMSEELGAIEDEDERYQHIFKQKSKRFGDYEWIYGEIIDDSGYGFINTCHERFGFKKVPYTVEHEIFVMSVA